jgi:chemotaxis protein histidine kinase CheA
MSAMALDDELIQDYLVECVDHLTTIEADLLAIEHAGAAIDEQLVNRVFRAAHSIKGGAGFFDLVKIQELAHKIENVLDLVRSRQMVPNPKIVSVLLSAFDRLRALVLNCRESNDADISTFVNALTELAAASLKEQANSLNEEVVVKSLSSPASLKASAFDLAHATSSGRRIYLLEYDLIDDIQVRTLTPLDLLHRLLENGELLDSRLGFESVGTLDDDNLNRLKWEVLYASAAEAHNIDQIVCVPREHIQLVEKDGTTKSLPEGTPVPVMGNIMSTTTDRQKVVEEFLIESNENMLRLDQEMVQLEKNPKDPNLIASIFRTIHTIKGTCGFVGFTALQSVTHMAENVLCQLRDGKRELTPDLATLLLDTVDATRRMLGAIESTGNEGTDNFHELRKRLQGALEAPIAAKSPSPTAPSGQSAETSVPLVPIDPAEVKNVRGNDVSAPTEAEPSASQRTNSLADSTIRVAVELLDKLMNLVGELVLTRNQILQFNAGHNDSTLNAASQRLNLITTELQGGVMKTRMQPIGVVWNKVPRLVRDLSSSFGKQI